MSAVHSLDGFVGRARGQLVPESAECGSCTEAAIGCSPQLVPAPLSISHSRLQPSIFAGLAIAAFVSASDEGKRIAYERPSRALQGNPMTGTDDRHSLRMYTRTQDGRYVSCHVCPFSGLARSPSPREAVPCLQLFAKSAEADVQYNECSLRTEEISPGQRIPAQRHVPSRSRCRTQPVVKLSRAISSSVPFGLSAPWRRILGLMDCEEEMTS